MVRRDEGICGGGATVSVVGVWNIYNNRADEHCS